MPATQSVQQIGLIAEYKGWGLNRKKVVTDTKVPIQYIMYAELAAMLLTAIVVGAIPPGTHNLVVHDYVPVAHQGHVRQDTSVAVTGATNSHKRERPSQANNPPVGQNGQIRLRPVHIPTADLKRFELQHPPVDHDGRIRLRPVQIPTADLKRIKVSHPPPAGPSIDHAAAQLLHPLIRQEFSYPTYPIPHRVALAVPQTFDMYHAHAALAAHAAHVPPAPAPLSPVRSISPPHTPPVDEHSDFVRNVLRDEPLHDRSHGSPRPHHR